MTPLTPITPNAASIMPFSSMMTPDATQLGTSGIQMPDELVPTQSVTGAQPTSDSFASMLGQMVSDVNSAQQTSAQAVSALQSGQNVPLHQAVIAMEEANVSFQLMVEVRNRMMDAYQEIMRMQL
jgi:flagellar hook-basal body complex protein FliE